MSALALKLPFEDAPARPRLVSVRPPAARTATLDGALSLVWTALAAGHPAECPVCTGTLTPSGDGGGSCGSCGSTLR